MLYQSTYFKDRFPEDNKYFETVLVDDVAENLADSLGLLRTTMLSRPIEAAVFIGGMEGIYQEHEIFRALHGSAAKIGRAHVWTPVTNAHLVCRLVLEKKKPGTRYH